MINPLRQFLSVTLVLSLLSANGLYFAPLLKQAGSEGNPLQCRNAAAVAIPAARCQIHAAVHRGIPAEMTIRHVPLLRLHVPLH